MTLYILGMGIYEEPSIPYSYYRWIKHADKVYLETYTSPLRIDVRKLKNLLGLKEITPLCRHDIEEKDLEIVRDASTRNIVILVPGDPLIATTHATLILDSIKNGVDIKVIHSSSALCSAIGESGLHTYKFGAFCTLMREEKASSSRCYQVLKDNIQRSLHTLYFLEYDLADNYIMSPKEALEILIKYDEHQLLPNEKYVIVLCGLGSRKEVKKALKINEVIYGKKDFGEEPCILIIPGELHFTEEEYIKLALKGD